MFDEEYITGLCKESIFKVGEITNLNTYEPGYTATIQEPGVIISFIVEK